MQVIMVFRFPLPLIHQRQSSGCPVSMLPGVELVGKRVRSTPYVESRAIGFAFSPFMHLDLERVPQLPDVDLRHCS